MFNVKLVREEFPATKKCVYLDAAVKGLTPKRVYNKLIALADEQLYGSIYWDRWEEELDKARENLARLINAKPEEVALTHCTSDGINAVANALRWRRGVNIVINDLEFPSNVFPWQAQSRRHGVELRVARSREGKIDFEEYERLIDDETLVVAVSHVEFSSGFKHNLRKLAEVAHEHGAYLVVDATQSLGALRIDVKRDGVDFLATAGFKWLLGPPGTGFLYIKEELLEKLEPAYVGWRSVVDRENFSFRWYELDHTARRFETGVPNMAGLIALGEAARFLLELGPDLIERYTLSLAKAMVEGFTGEGLKVGSPVEEEHMSPIVYVAGGEELRKRLLDAKVVFSVRFGMLRFSPHLYNTQEEVKFVVELASKSRA